MGINQYIKVGKKMKDLRKERGIPQKEMAKKLGLAVSTYSNYENGYREPPLDIIESFCNLLNITLEELLNLAFEEAGTLNTDSENNRKFLHEMVVNLVSNLQYLSDNNMLDDDILNALHELDKALNKQNRKDTPD